MLDIIIVLALALLFLLAIFRWRTSRERGLGFAVASGALLLAFIIWWYLLGPLVTG